MCNLSRVLARVLSILRSHVIDTKPEIHPLPGTASTPANIAVWLILTVPVLAGPKFFYSTFQHLTFSEGTLAFIGRGSGSQFNWEGLASFGHTQNLQFLLPVKATGGTKRCQDKEWFPFLCPSPVEKSLIPVSLMEGLTIYTIYGILWPLGEFYTSSTS